MKALAIDSSSPRTVVAARNGVETATVCLDTGMKQSRQLLPAVDYALSAVGLEPSELEFTALSAGPGTFTGLRISFSALKAIELAHGVPVYGIPSLLTFAEPFSGEDSFVVPVMDAKKGQFFASAYKCGEEILAAEDTTAERVAAFLSEKAGGAGILTVGPDAETFADLLAEAAPALNVRAAKICPPSAETLLRLAAERRERNEPPLRDYDGPLYLRKSEAELALETK